MDMEYLLSFGNSILLHVRHPSLSSLSCYHGLAGNLLNAPDLEGNGVPADALTCMAYKHGRAPEI